ncbi:hypothetical protein ASC58_03890 [Phycicoccus sp. Root101]|nr:hypothetical protein ASC58_03890 [Phycicoccus sp. Root101]
MDVTTPPPLRVDAEANRARIVQAAQAVFAEQGVSAPLTEVAARAGVGIATLYRRFPDRADLVAEAFDDALRQYEASADLALTDDDPWAGFVGLVERMAALQAENRGFTHLIQSVPLGRGSSTAARGSSGRRELGSSGRRERGYRTVVEVIDRAKSSGVLRADFSPEDLPVLTFAVAGVIETTRDDLPEAWRRHVALFLDACRPIAATPLPPAPEPIALQRAMLRAARRRQTRGQSG